KANSPLAALVRREDVESHRASARRWAADQQPLAEWKDMVPRLMRANTHAGMHFHYNPGGIMIADDQETHLRRREVWMKLGGGLTPWNALPADETPFRAKAEADLCAKWCATWKELYAGVAA